MVGGAVSWDVLVFHAPANVAAVDEIPSDFHPPALGSGAEVRQRLYERLPKLDLSDPTWGMLSGPTWSIEINIGSEDPVTSIMLHVRGGGDEVLPVIAQIADALGARVLDVSSGELLSGTTADAVGWRGFQQYRDQVLGP
jgi:hypothetical protein